MSHLSRSKILHSFYQEDYRKWKHDCCEECGKRDHRDSDGYLISRAQLTVHHLDGNVVNNEPENLITLCHKCHDKLHNT